MQPSVASKSPTQLGKLNFPHATDERVLQAYVTARTQKNTSQLSLDELQRLSLSRNRIK